MRGKPFVLILLIVSFFILAAATGRWDSSGTKSDAAGLVVPDAVDRTQLRALPKQPLLADTGGLSEHIVHYDIEAHLDEVQMTISGRQTLLWTHPGQREVDHAYFHTYPNAFMSDQTTFMRESDGRLRNDTMPINGYGNMTIDKIVYYHASDVEAGSSNSGIDLTALSRYVQPDDGNVHDRTLLYVPLPQAVAPNEQALFVINFTVELPYAFARMGAVDDFVMAGQWHPKISVYETAGMRSREEEGWNMHQYHGNSEFYADFGTYDVTLNLPANYVVAATGSAERETERFGKRKIHRFQATDIHDFAWAASPHFIKKEAALDLPNDQQVKLHLYLDPAHEHLQDRYWRAANSALRSYGEWFGPYPYPTLSIVVPPTGAGGAGGMEYPTLVTAWAADEQDPGYELERVIVHEIGHQYFYGMVASNEFEEAWLDEAFTSYAEDRVMHEEYGLFAPTPVEAGYITDPAPLDRDAWRYHDHDHYAENVYMRGKLVLKEIEKRIGKQKMDQVLRQYYEQWKFRHPSTTDFQHVLEQVTQQRWDAFFHTFVHADGMTDYTISSITSRKAQLEESGMFEHTITLERLGAEYPQVPLRIRYADGTANIKLLDGTPRVQNVTLHHPSALLEATIDPYYTMILENRRLNNTMRAHVEKQERIRWTLAAVYIVENALKWLVW